MISDGEAQGHSLGQTFQPHFEMMDRSPSERGGVCRAKEAKCTQRPRAGSVVVPDASCVLVHERCPRCAISVHAPAHPER